MTFAQVKSYYLIYMKLIDNRFSYLRSIHKLFSDKQRKLLRRSTILRKFSTETSLKAHISSKDTLKKYIRHLQPIEQSAFEDSLLKAKKWYSTRSPLSKDIKLNDLIRTSQRVEKYIRTINKLETVSIDTSVDALIKSSSSGFPYFKQQGKIIDRIRLDSKRNWKHNLTHYYAYPLSLAFRIQLREKINDVVFKTRCIFMNPVSIKVDENRFFIPIYNHLKTNCKFYSTGKTGGELSSSLKLRFYKRITPNNFRLTSTDFSSYDQTVPNELICLAFAIIRKQFRLSKRENVLYENIVAYFCTSFVATNVGSLGPDLFIKTHGIPSGSTFTNLIGTIVHAIMLEHIYPGILNKSLICSDDNIFDSTNKSIDHYNKLMSSFGMLPKVEHFYSYRKFYYLGFNWIDFKRHISLLLTINQIIYHSEFRTDLSDIDRYISRTASVLLNGVNGPSVFKTLLPLVYKYALEDYDITFLFFNSAKPSFVSLEPSRNSLKQHLLNGWSLR